MKTLVAVLLYVLLPGLLAEEYYNTENQLLASLTNNYSVGSRPSRTTIVTTKLMLFSLNKVDIESEEMSITGVMVSIWHDPRLVWNFSHVGIESIVTKTTNVWYPPLLIENDVKKVEVLDARTPLRIRDDGAVIWAPPFAPVTSCSADITYYPYDKQTCNITLAGWSYVLDEVELVANLDEPVDTDHYSANGEWELTGTGYQYHTWVETDSTMIFRKVIFQISVRRKWQYYGQIIMLPVFLNSLLMAVAFALPIDSGERMGYCLTVLLSYIVLLTIVSANLPPISSQISFIQMYLSLVMCLGTSATICTIGVLRLYHRDEEKNPIPGWMQTFARSVLAPWICATCQNGRGVSPHDSETKINQNMKRIYSAKDIAYMMDSFFFKAFTLVMLTVTITFISILVNQY